MEEQIIASRDGTAGPYVVVPKSFADSFCEHVNRNGHRALAPRDALFQGARPTDCVLETPERPKEVEAVIDDWFESQRIEAIKSREGEDADPMSIYWHFNPSE